MSINLNSGANIVTDGDAADLTVIHRGGVPKRRLASDYRAPETLDMRDFVGLDPTGTNSNSSIIDAAITQANNYGNNIRILFPNGVFVTDKALVTNVDGKNPNCQHVLPLHPSSSTGLPLMWMDGAVPPNMNMGMISDFPNPNTGTIIKSTITGNGAVFGSSWDAAALDFNALHFKATRLTVRTNAGTSGSKISNGMTAWDLSNLCFVSLDELRVDTTLAPFVMLTPQNTAYGIKMPKDNNGGYARAGTLNVQGYHKAVRISEHTDIEVLNAHGNTISAFFSGDSAHTYHSSRIGRLISNGAEIGIYLEETAKFVIGLYSGEHANGAQFYPFFTDLYEAAGDSQGNIVYATSNQGGSGFDISWREASYEKAATLTTPVARGLITGTGETFNSRFNIKKIGEA